MTDLQLAACRRLDERFVAGELSAAEYTRLHDIARGPVSARHSNFTDTCVEDGIRYQMQVRVF